MKGKRNMTHYMNLWDDSFQAIKEGWKTVEMRLYDGKRKLINVADTIEFTNTKTKEKLSCRVTNIYRYPNFTELYKNHDKLSIGYKDNETASPNDMLLYYSAEDIEKYGVVGIKLKTVDPATPAINIELMTFGHPLWNETISFADSCSWRAGHYLAERMSKNDFSETERVLVAIENEKIIGYCTFSLKDELPDDSPYSPFIGFMFVDEGSRGKRISERLINAAIDHARTVGHKTIYIMSGEQGLYEKYGFEKVGDFKTIYGSVDQLFQKHIGIDGEI